MMFLTTLLLGVGLVLPVQAAAPSDSVTVLLKQQTQQLLDAVSAGDRNPWTRYLDEKARYTAEDGGVKSKAQLVDEIGPLPKGISGVLKVAGFEAVVHGTTAITNYIADEEETYFGQTLHAQYRETDTWIETRAGWRLIAAQVLAIRHDPPAVTLQSLEEYVGVYLLTPDVTYTISRDAEGLKGQKTGRKAEALLVELRDCLFVPGQPRLRKIFQRDASGRITGFVERRESWDVTWRRQGQ